ncbi:hypothetical protein FACS189467_5530 [Bacteroidia bacterium]|nr:hypothetical protein FACS189467_5530 [Bacteroidia bacterium]
MLCSFFLTVSLQSNAQNKQDTNTQDTNTRKKKNANGRKKKNADLTQYILTPPAPKTPRINGAKVFGARPGSIFTYTIPATGTRPMTFSAEGLPKGLRLDASTGKISGKVKKMGKYPVKLKASNEFGSTERNFRIMIGDRIALTPPMGWSSGNCRGNDVDQEKVLDVAQAMIDKDLINHGWTYVNIGDSWQSERGEKYNAIQSNDKFPDMKELADQNEFPFLIPEKFAPCFLPKFFAHHK